MSGPSFILLMVLALIGILFVDAESIKNMITSVFGLIIKGTIAVLFIKMIITAFKNEGN